ncbi:hemerythrin domain-containing protein [Sphingobium sp. Sx8-8]|uniref:hemerythrin domain-containing protein n=1 Tax=Sphingobium sp. Sx8-8 TaxID=2933617 RepID=UPI001F5889A1|nr:hemerythrin domain-containing protein [Sphingobium sp. Sx8-8]
MDIGELQRQHRELSVTASQLARAIADDAVRQSVGALRWQLARQLMTHLALEDRIFYPGVQRAGDDHARRTASRLQTEMGPLAEAFSAYMARWSDDRVSREWAGFCAETRELLDVLASRIEKEDRILYPLVDSNRASAARISRTA